MLARLLCVFCLGSFGLAPLYTLNGSMLLDQLFVVQDVEIEFFTGSFGFIFLQLTVCT
jgi:hypothetical protein